MDPLWTISRSLQFMSIASDSLMRMCVILAGICAVLVHGVTACPAPDPEFVFRNPPKEAHAGIWWHWMGGQVTREGIVKDLDWFQRMGITSATIFGLSDTVTPWAKRIANLPAGSLRPYSDEWWQLVRFALKEGVRRGIDMGLHNCPGYTSTGGKWITPALSMKQLVFGVTNAALQVSARPDSRFPVYNETTGAFEKPEWKGRPDEYRSLGVVRGVEVGFVPMGAYVQPTDWDSRGLECDKMSAVAVAAHLDHIIGEWRRHLGGDLRKAGLTHVLLDSYEAGSPTWTENMRDEFRRRRGYDCLDYLPILGGYTNLYTQAECDRFAVDFDRTIRDLYRDVLFETVSRRLHEEGLLLSCEPYGGPFEAFEVARYIDRIMTEFWYRPERPARIFSSDHEVFHSLFGPDCRRHRIVEAEAFTSNPEERGWTATPASLKSCGDRAWLQGVNRFVLHTCPLQPWDDDVRPGVTMGRWGTQFGRTQTWAESGRVWFDYIARSQALLQWGNPYDFRYDIPFSQIARESENRGVHFIVNEGGERKPLSLPDKGRWFDPVFGRIGAPPATLGPGESGFWVTGCGVAEGTFDVGACSAEITGWMPSLGDRTKDADPEVRYHSGVTRYRASFDCERLDRIRFVELGVVFGATAHVCINGVDCGTVWYDPWRASIPEGALREKDNEIVVEIVNVWANRLVGDEQEPEDVAFAPGPLSARSRGDMLLAYPEWFKDGLSARPSKGRRCFTTWRHHRAEDALVPTGLVGPVRLRTN